MGWPKREDSRTVDQNVDVPVYEFHCSSRDFPRARRILKVKRYKVCFASCCADFRYGLFASIGIATDDYDMNAKLSQFIGHRPADTTCSSCNQCCRRISSHFASYLNPKPKHTHPRLRQDWKEHASNPPHPLRMPSIASRRSRLLSRTDRY